ncbi:hypothetical protein ACFPFP_36955 [Bradyrhizobium sp. GCM10023182]|uniref:Uncharacterized protein n=1 Tax=Bradyrhizobium zhengyangense TaxID=2911009 RepID=A0ABS9LZR7_9BRAD|nr:hypothetical protein [Bradyrhizobium zhengyangense]MCG2672524.1 hypothetical protein [Bradyrhizobium zhengyangense]
MIKYYSFEETLVLVGAIVVAAIGYKVFKVGPVASAVLGLIAASTIVYLTLVELSFDGEIITHRNLFKENSFPVSYVETVGMSTFWAGLPGHQLMFVLRSPPAPVNGYFLRTGLVSWPSASRWVAAVNAASLRAKKTQSQGPTP